MTIQELIDALSQFKPNTPVVVHGYESGYNDIMEVREISVQLNINRTWFYGAHGNNDSQSELLPDIPLTPVVYLHGYNHIADEDWHDR